MSESKRADVKFILGRGISGSGKSTTARSIQKEFPLVVVSRDDIRLSLFGEAFGPRVDEDVVTMVEFDAIRAGLSAGYDVYSDNTNLYPEPVIERLVVAKGIGAKLVLSEISVTLAAALENNRKRGVSGGRFVPEHVITKQEHAFFEHQETTKEIISRMNQND